MYIYFLFQLYHSEHNKEPHQDNSLEDNRFSSGTLHHDFSFQSVYPHTQTDGQREASTHHDNWITVDYASAAVNVLTLRRTAPYAVRLVFTAELGPRRTLYASRSPIL
ncbi:hypothetical protein J6590_025198 [Homalodisca vitripennis]|nr:hypothetical protein J6590_025198 [Homalodisca vitripennis]